MTNSIRTSSPSSAVLPRHGDAVRGRDSAPTTAATTARICSARPTWSGKAGSAGSTRRCCSASRPAGRNRATIARAGRFAGLPGNRAPLDRSRRSTSTSPSPRPAATPTTAPAPTVAAIYVQDQIRPADWLEIVAGLRFDSFKLKVDDLRAGSTDFSRTDNLWSPRLGLILKPQDNLSLYASYSRSYLPQSGDQFSGLDPGHRPAQARAVRQLRARRQVGADRGPARHRRRLPARPHQHPGARSTHDQIVLTGAQRSRGRRAGPRAQHQRPLAGLRRLCLAEGGDHARPPPPRPRDGSAAGPAPQLLAVDPLRLHRPRSALGLGVIARSKIYASISNAVTLPGYARLDAALYYESGAASRRRSMSRISSAPIISRPRTTTIISRPARRGR